MLLLAFLLPCMVLSSQPPGSQAGMVLGIFAMCGANPVDCGNGWCCPSGETCSVDSKNTMCIGMQGPSGCRYVTSVHIFRNQRRLIVAAAKNFQLARHTLGSFKSTRPHLREITTQELQQLSNPILLVHLLNLALTACSFYWSESPPF